MMIERFNLLGFDLDNSPVVVEGHHDSIVILGVARYPSLGAVERPVSEADEPNAGSFLWQPHFCVGNTAHK